jgi:hypothetical protein
MTWPALTEVEMVIPRIQSGAEKKEKKSYYIFPLYLESNETEKCCLLINIPPVQSVILTNSPMMRFFYRIINLFRGRRPHKPAALTTAGKEDYERWLGI